MFYHQTKLAEMKVTERKMFYDIFKPPYVETGENGYKKLFCDKYPNCKECELRFKCYTEINEIVRLVK
jgi:hypothetical protein